MTLRARLTLALIALALIPTIVYTVFTLDQLGRATERWFRPGVSRALSSALEVTSTLLARHEASVLARAEALAERFPAGPRDDAARANVRTMLSESGLDFVQHYRRVPGGLELVEQLTPPGVIAPWQPDLGAEITRSIDSSRVIHSPQGALAGVAPLRDGGVLAVGMWVAPDFFTSIEDVGTGVSRYGQLGVLVGLQRRYVWLLVSLLVIGVSALALLLADRLASGMSRPLRELAVAFESVAAGELGTRVTPSGARELRTLAIGFNHMTAGLEAARESLKEAEREAAWRAVARRLAHEFKNILTPMALSLHRLSTRADTVPPDQRAAVRDSLAALERGVEHLTRLAEQFSQYARLPEPRFEPLDFTALIGSAAAMHEHPGVAVAIRPGPPLMVVGDSLLLSRAVHNLLLNACEASPSGERVEAHTFASNGRAVVEIVDRGPGLPPELGERVFEPYVSTKQRSSGLGLALVRDIATQHGGSVTLENREDGGARARFAVPLIEEGGQPAANA